MNTNKVSKRFSNVEVIPGNGYSPHTGCMVFKCYDNTLGLYATVKASDGIKNVHMTVKEEYDFLYTIRTPGVIRVLDYYEEAGVQYMVMLNEHYTGGRRERWRKILLKFSKNKFERLLFGLMGTLHSLQQINVLHDDIECANMLYSEITGTATLIDFGRARKIEYDMEWLIGMLRLGQVTKQNAFFREITNSGGVYVTEPKHFIKFDPIPVINNTLNKVLEKVYDTNR